MPDTSAEVVRYIADLHIHSPYSRATSKSSNLAGLAAWSAVKGIDVIGTGDFTHPGWFRELRENLKPAEPGFFKLKNDDIPQILEAVPTDKAQCRFILTAEISSIYKSHGSVRKIHNILFVPDFDSASKINTRLASIGNIESDGRPILGLDAHDLLEIVLESAPDGFLVPAHIWTPWFSLFGSKSGFDSIDECFGDLSKYIFALETGLSSDPEMNRLVSALDRFTLISNSDCHSPGKLGREANIFACGFNFFSMRDALKNPTVGGFQGTIEFFPEEGKYHHDGHRKCGINLNPQETKKVGGICPVCSRPLTIGVMHRVMELADRELPYFPSGSPGYYSLIPLTEVLGEIFSRGPATKTVMNEYGKIIRMFDSEFNLLLNVSVGEISERYSPVLGEAVKRIRKGKVVRRAGFDGEFGVIKVFENGELKELVGQFSLFNKEKKKNKPDFSTKSSLFEFTPVKRSVGSRTSLKSLNKEQLTAVASDARHIVVTAGPGTGKTYTLVARIQRLITEGRVKPGDITAITFTNRAADEMKERLERVDGLDAGKLYIGTFHAFCLDLLRKDEQDLTVVDETNRDKIIARLLPNLSSQEIKETKDCIETYYQLLASGSQKHSEEEMNARVGAYLKELKRRDGIDLSGVIPRVVYRLKTEKSFLNRVSSKVDYLFIDEFQDLNRPQYELVRTLATNSSIFAIGDPDQAIYGFRGSSPEFFHLFIDEFEAETIALGRNYRSAKKILQAAAAVIANNYGSDTKQSSKLIVEHNDIGNIELFQAPSPQAEAEFVVRRIEELMDGISHFSIDSGRTSESAHDPGRSFKDFSVLYRLTKQAQYLQEALERRGIPFQMVNVKPFFMHREVRPVYYWIRAAGTGRDAIEVEVYLELLRSFPGVGESTLTLLEKQLPFGGFSDFFALAAEINLPKTLRDRVDDLQQNLISFRKNVSEKGLSGPIMKSMDYLRVNAKSEDAIRFLELAGSFGSDLFGFADYLHKNEAATVYEGNAEAVALLTLHGAKGLEFPVVFITGMEEGIFPCRLHGDEKRNAADITATASIHEERRLFYVGMTRAQDSLILTSSVTRPIFGSYQSRPVSRFVNEIPESLCEQIKQKRPRKKKSGAKQMKLF
jgi:DNA helicase-2/ATP-dependent DNA helicase PcrA